jgi:hypothetical protein
MTLIIGAPNRKYPKAFEDWYARAERSVGRNQVIIAKVKHIAFNAWKAGRIYEKHQRDTSYGF